MKNSDIADKTVVKFPKMESGDFLDEHNCPSCKEPTRHQYKRDFAGFCFSNSLNCTKCGKLTSIWASSLFK